MASLHEFVVEILPVICTAALMASFLLRDSRSAFSTNSFITCTLTKHYQGDAYNILVGKPEGKRSLERRRRRWENNIRIDRREIGWQVVDWMHLAQDRDQWRAAANTVMDLWVP
jgi:hypothetical protein